MHRFSNEDMYIDFNLNTVDVPSIEDGPRSLDIGNEFKFNILCSECMCVGGWVRRFMLSNEDMYMDFNLNTVDVPSIEDGPRSLDISNEFKFNFLCSLCMYV